MLIPMNSKQDGISLSYTRQSTLIELRDEIAELSSAFFSFLLTLIYYDFLATQKSNNFINIKENAGR